MLLYRQDVFFRNNKMQQGESSQYLLSVTVSLPNLENLNNLHIGTGLC